MRIRVSGVLLLLTIPVAVHAAGPAMRLDLPAGPLSSAVALLAERSGANIGTLTPRLLAAPLPALHLSGTTESILKALARRANAGAVRLGGNAWQLVPRPSSRRANEAQPVARPAAEIVVQGAKRSEGLADYPAELVRIGSAGLDRYGAAQDTRLLSAQAPALIATDWGAGRNKLFLRGIADSSFTGSSPALVGEYVGDQRLTYNTPDPDLRLYDIASVEILEGPQGTLYGAGSLGGLIRVEPNMPVFGRTSGSLWAGFDGVAHGATGGDVGATINLPLVDDRLAFRATGYAITDPGYIDDTGRGLLDVNRTRTRGGRATLRWRVAEGWTVDLGGIVQRIDNRDAPFVDVGAPLLTRSSRDAQPAYNHFLAGSIGVTGHLGGMEIRSTTGIVHQALGERFDVLQTANAVRTFDDREHPTLISQEVRLSGGTAGMNWVVGASILSNEDREMRTYGSQTIFFPVSLHDRTRDLTGYGEATKRLAPGVSATFGLRYSSIRSSGSAVSGRLPVKILAITGAGTDIAPARSRERHLLPSVALSYKPASGLILFSRYERGFRPGGLTIASDVQRFEADHVDTLELGTRYGVAGQDRIALSLTGATSWWRHVQADLLDGLGLPYVATVGNGRVRSLDATAAIRLLPALSLEAGGFLARGRLHPTPEVAADGDANILPNVARTGGTLALRYRGRISGDRNWGAGLRAQYVGRSLVGIGPFLARPQGNYTTLALDADIRFGRFDLTLDATNLLDSHANAFAIGTPFAGLIRQQYTPLQPRTVRIGARYDF